MPIFKKMVTYTIPWILQRAKQAGLHVTVHAAESGPAENVRQAIQELGAERIGHGYHVLDDSKIYQLAMEAGVHFEVHACACIVSTNHALHVHVQCSMKVLSADAFKKDSSACLYALHMYVWHQQQWHIRNETERYTLWLCRAAVHNLHVQHIHVHVHSVAFGTHRLLGQAWASPILIEKRPPRNIYVCMYISYVIL